MGYRRCAECSKWFKPARASQTDVVLYYCPTHQEDYKKPKLSEVVTVHKSLCAKCKVSGGCSKLTRAVKNWTSMYGERESNALELRER